MGSRECVRGKAEWVLISLIPPSQVRRQRTSSPLFNTRLLTHNLERAYMAMWSQYEQYGVPNHLEVKGYDTMEQWEEDRRRSSRPGR